MPRLEVSQNSMYRRDVPIRIEQDQHLKTVAVLLATHNGLQWISTQVESILSQVNVDLRLIISDDLSTDGTWDWLQKLANQDTRVTVLPQNQKFGSAAANFYRLLLDANLDECDFIAYSDQDDVWELDKLDRHIYIADQGKYEGVSSNVTAFWADGSSALLIKSQAQRKLDYLFESAGPGSTFLMTPWLVGELRRLLVNPASCARKVASHDWLTYAVCRAAERPWHIDEVSTVRYRQHPANELGANYGFKAGLSRLKKLKMGWYRTEIMKILSVCMTLSRDPAFIDLTRLLHEENLINRIRLLRYISRARRRAVDRIALMGAILVFLF